MYYVSSVARAPTEVSQASHKSTFFSIFTSPPLSQETSLAKESSQDDCVAKFELWLSSEDIILNKKQPSISL
jgi:hypothetical protein